MAKPTPVQVTSARGRASPSGPVAGTIAAHWSPNPKRNPNLA